MDYNILVGGKAGQGMDTFAGLLEKILQRLGFNIYAHSDYMSRVRGGHNFFYIRFSDKELYSYSPDVDVVFALDEETVKNHNDKLKKDGIIIADSDIAKDSNIIHIPLNEITGKLKNAMVASTVGLGAILKYFGLPMDAAIEVIKDELSEKVVEDNIAAIKEGYNLIDTKYNLETKINEKILINGNQAAGVGAIAAGVKFYCGYPMTPSTGVLNYVAQHSDKYGIAVDQVEDEVAALNMALGASYAGVRAMTGSSGGGFALMVEALSLAGMIEVPIVVINVQRPGPATGFPTRTEQADLQFMIHAGHGEFPRMIMAFRDAEDAFYQTARAFNIAEKYQIPVLLMSDQYLADSIVSKEPFDFNKINIERHITNEIDTDEKYRRYKLTEDGISPRILPGKIEGQVVLVDSDEHDEFGNITESDEIRIKMVNKRLKKFDGLREEVQEPWFIGEEYPENLVVCWGSTYGAVKEAVSKLNAEGVSIGALVFGDIWPFPTKKLLELSKNAMKIIDVEQNATAQLDNLMRQEALIKSTDKILKYDGRPFSGEELYLKIMEVL
ncbi:2-oxoacid:acceptor oxidoreductase subunit alpha [Sedimentibacter saalensis]|jgi:2-oxoglutarate ferredoxin oxidoreductase subunit alpha|uniref:2-oxoglutarate ferredoxin oxidoreductase subunit alpha n=1 Tax=Sedimentibacter saalensis TaxID=130788 RepID=A0A562JJN9_9FIRM|nr:2-oxoacid:acceptor oxidoreductase subunit alpha [Sedimentibacter saalensis]TWH83432.1 2-oxoglutarate ferredoxin oxidoreductase subunit alpha [Sedimentibacter saalensis]